MNYLNGLFDTDGSIEIIRDGLIYHKTRLALGIAKSEVKGYRNGAVEIARNNELSSREGQDNNLSELEKFNGEKFRVRNMTNCLTMSTVYGVQGQFTCVTPQHSCSGMSKKYLTNEGLPNETVIIKRLRELGSHHDVKEARFGQFYNLLFTKDYYDNMTPLFVKMHLFATKLSIIERMQVYDHDIVVKTHMLSKVYLAKGEEEKTKVFNDIIRTIPTGIGFCESDYKIEELKDQSMRWYEANKNDPEKKEMTVSVRVWKMYKYNDGHNVSGRTYGVEYGFINGLFLVPYSVSSIYTSDEIHLVKSKDCWFTEENMERTQSKYKGYLNLSGFTTVEMSIVNQMFCNRPRDTPLLCDQEIKIAKDDDKFYVVASGEVNLKDCMITSGQVRATMSKLAMNHRAHEDMLCAIRACRYTLAQPANEAAEAHWWNILPRKVNLPKLGLKRAAMHFMLEDEGVCISLDAIKTVREYLAKGDRAVLESTFLNTCWYWAEYMRLYNRNHSYDIVDSLLKTDIDELVDGNRTDILVSTIIGRPMPLPTHSCCTTQWCGTLYELAHKTVQFGKLNLENASDYGYTIGEGRVTLNRMVPPSGAAMVTGLGGSLINATPMGSMFGMNNAVRVRIGNKTQVELNYNDLWALGVVGRFLGYDIVYCLPNGTAQHVTRCADNVNIASPPITFDPRLRDTSYRIVRIDERSTTFGSDPALLTQASTVFYWNRQPTATLSEPKWNSTIINSEVEQAINIRGFEMVSDDSKKYAVAISATYDIDVSDFHVARLTAGIALPTSGGGLLLDDENQEDPPT